MKLLKLNYSNIVLATLISIMAFTSCTIDEGSRGVVSPESQYASFNGAQAGIDGFYGLYKQSINNASLMKDVLGMYTGADDITCDASKTQYLQGDLFIPSAGNQIAYRIWDGKYQTINAVNLFLENIKQENFSAEQFAYLLAHGHFIRGLCYYDLAMIFEEMPLVLKSEVDLTISASDITTVLFQVQKDLEVALENFVALEEDANFQNPRDTKSGVDSRVIDGHGGINATRAFLAKTHLALAGWPSKQDKVTNMTAVKSYTKAIIDEDIYSLLDDYAHNFGWVGTTSKTVGVQDWEGNKEVVFSFVATNFSTQHWQQIRYYGSPWTDWGDYVVEWHFYEKMPKDYRGGYSIAVDTFPYLGFTDYKLWSGHPSVAKFQWGMIQSIKWNIYQGNIQLLGTPSEDFPGFEDSYNNSTDLAVIRYAEVLLMYAEACAETGEAAEAEEKLNWVRRRAYAGGLPALRDTIDKAISAGTLTTEYWKTTAEPAVDYPQAGETDLVQEIIDERAWEFLGEIGGVRWFDLTRKEMVAQAVADRQVPGLTDDTKTEVEIVGDPALPENWRFPIPAQEGDYNPNLK